MKDHGLAITKCQSPIGPPSHTESKCIFVCRSCDHIHRYQSRRRLSLTIAFLCLGSSRRIQPARLILPAQVSLLFFYCSCHLQRIATLLHSHPTQSYPSYHISCTCHEVVFVPTDIKLSHKRRSRSRHRSLSIETQPTHAQTKIDRHVDM